MLLILGHSSKLGSSFIRNCPEPVYYCYSRSTGLIFFSNGQSTGISFSSSSLLEILFYVKPTTIISFVGSKSRSFASLKSNLLFLNQFSTSIDLYLNSHDSQLLFLNVGSFGSSSPYEPSFKIDKLNFYEFFKYYESCVHSSLTNRRQSYAYISVLPSIIVFPRSNYLKKLFLLMLIFPLSLSSPRHSIPLISSRTVTDSIDLLSRAPSDYDSMSLILTRSYSLYYIHTSFAKYSTLYAFFSKFKISTPQFLYPSLSYLFELLFSSKLFLPTYRYSFTQ